MSRSTLLPLGRKMMSLITKRLTTLRTFLKTPYSMTKLAYFLSVKREVCIQISTVIWVI